MKFILYALIAFLVVQMIRTTMRIRTNARKWDDNDDKEKPRPPVVNIPDIEEANFEDISDQPEGEEKKPGDGAPTSSGGSTPHR
jgi:hypothetical protein